uniref:CSON010964 protein n=1 Tax=Culicoides sonorensis TaxID=179676 RepID=A0A336K1U8_CULSO
MKKRFLLIGIAFLTLVSGDPDISEKSDVSRFARLHTSITHQQSGNKYSSVSSSVVQSTPKSVKSAQNAVHQTTQKPSEISSNQNTGYKVQEQLQPPTASAAQFIFGVNSAPQAGSTQGFIPTAGPMLMQILTPQGQPTGQVQYIQFLRPVMVPLVSQTYMQTALNQGALPSIAQPQVASAPVQSASAAVAQQYLPTTPQPPNTGFYPYAQQPLAAYSSPIASYYHPNIYSTNRVQIVNPPTEINLNTDEYMPAAAEMSYKIIKPLVRS